MHLLMNCLRLLAVKAIQGQTWVGDAVFDSPSTPTDIRVKADRASFIAVYVDECDENYADDPAIMSPGGSNTIRVIIEVGVASPHRTGDGKPGPSGSADITQIDATDPGLEMQLGLISRQAFDALQAVGDAYPYSELWRSFTGGQIQKVEVRRGGPNQEQRTPQRYASRVSIIHVGTISEPQRGVDLDDYPVWRQFFAALEDDEEYGDITKLMKAHIVRPSHPESYAHLAQKALGVSAETVDMIGLGPRATLRFNASPSPDFTGYDDVPSRPSLEPAVEWFDAEPDSLKGIDT